ncbi:MAG TPA: inositol monophosphatase family protein [Candidatus Nitrosotenuis sp.]|nr:inositol monophosphatase family protein [Candidatus Nitrosotenuis sp.]
MQVIDVLKEASRQVYQNVKDIAGTVEAAEDHGRGAGGDISRKIDIVAEKTVLDYLKKINFECTVLGEECGRVELAKNPKGFLIMDAIDGSANAVRGIPFFCCSLAFATEDRLSSVTDGVVTDLSNGNMYWATKGKGAFLNDKRIYVHKQKPVYKIVGINVSGATPELVKRIQPIFENSNHSRHLGANALELALFARGLIDIYVDLRQKIRVTDMAAGYLIAKEADGIILDENLKPLDSNLSYETRLSFIAAASQEILLEIKNQLKL